MADYVDVEVAIRTPGLRVVLTPGVPGPWSEAAKAILHVKQLKYLKARQEILGANVALLRWTAQATAPVVVWNDEPPRSTWIEQLFLFERLAPTPPLIPADFEARVLMFGLANEVMGENGFIWNRRHIMVRDYTKPHHTPEVREVYAALGRKYWYSPQAAEAAPIRCAEILRQLSTRLEQQRAHGSAYFIGDSLTALDLYWACAAALIEPLPEADCTMPAMFRGVYQCTDPIVQADVTPALMQHRDYIYRRYLELPVDL